VIEKQPVADFPLTYSGRIDKKMVYAAKVALLKLVSPDSRQ
jgi:hypothetical protein